MRGWPKQSLVLLLAVPALLFCAGCNDKTDDPEASESQLLVSAVTPSEACAARNGVFEDLDEDGTAEIVFKAVTQTFLFENRTRGAVLSQGSKWNDAHLSFVDITYQLDQGAALAPRSNIPIDVTVKANSTGSVALTTVVATDVESFNAVIGSPPNQGVAARGVIKLAFKGADAAGNPVSVSTQVALSVVDYCSTGP